MNIASRPHWTGVGSKSFSLIFLPFFTLCFFFFGSRQSEATLDYFSQPNNSRTRRLSPWVLHERWTRDVVDNDLICFLAIGPFCVLLSCFPFLWSFVLPSISLSGADGEKKTKTVRTRTSTHHYMRSGKGKREKGKGKWKWKWKGKAKGKGRGLHVHKRGKEIATDTAEFSGFGILILVFGII